MPATFPLDSSLARWTILFTPKIGKAARKQPIAKSAGLDKKASMGSQLMKSLTAVLASGLLFRVKGKAKPLASIRALQIRSPAEEFFSVSMFWFTAVSFRLGIFA